MSDAIACCSLSNSIRDLSWTIPSGNDYGNPLIVEVNQGIIMETGDLSKMDKAGSHIPTLNSIPLRPSLMDRCRRFKTGAVCCLLTVVLSGCGTMNGYVMNRSGRRYFDKGNYEYARYEFERALMDDPHNANYAYNVARTMEREGELENAEAMYQHALTLDPAHQPSYHSLASMLREQGRTAEAQELLVAWADTQPYSSEAQMTAANMYQQQGNTAAAQQHYQQALRDMPTSRRQRRLANRYSPQSYGMMNRGQQVAQSPRYPYHPTPSLQMANVMPQTDPTMMGGPVVAQRQTTSIPAYQQVPSNTPLWTPTEQTVPVPQQYVPATSPAGQPELLQDAPLPTSHSAPQAYIPQQYAGQPVYGTQPIYQQQPVIQQPIPTIEPGGPVQYEGAYLPPPTSTAPFQNISSQATYDVVPAVQPF